MLKRPSQILIGDILVKSELVTMAHFAEAMPISVKTGMPVGKVLISSGYLTDERLKQVLSVQSLIRDYILSPETGLAALKLVHKENIELTEALNKLGARDEYYEMGNRLGELLVEAAAIDNTELENALLSSFTSGLQLARVLVLNGRILQPVASMALIAQFLIRDNKITKARAIEAIKAVNKNIENFYTLELALASGIGLRRTNTLRLGELLLLAGVVSERNLAEAVEHCAIEEKPLGQMLTKMGQLSEITLSQALTLQEMVNNGTLGPEEAVHTLLKVHETGTILSKALSDAAPAAVQMSFPAFLQATGLISEKDCKRLEPLSGSDLMLSIKLQIADTRLPGLAEQCFDFYLKGRVTLEQAAFVVLLLIADRTKEDLQEILKSLQW